MRALLLETEGDLHHVSPEQVDELTRRVAGGLHARGIGPGDVVLVRLPKGLQWLCTIRALYRLGAIALPCPAQLTDRDMQDRVERSGAALALVDPADVPLGAGEAPRANLPDDAPAFLLFTSGTEGKPIGGPVIVVVMKADNGCTLLDRDLYPGRASDCDTAVLVVPYDDQPLGKITLEHRKRCIGSTLVGTPVINGDDELPTVALLCEHLTHRPIK